MLTLQKHIYFWLALLVFPSLTLAQGLFLEGKVTDYKGNPVSNAIIRFDNSSQLHYTNDNGVFSIDLPQQAKTLNIRAKTFVPKQFSLEYNYAERLEIVLDEVPLNMFNADSIITRAIAQRRLNEIQTSAAEGSFYKKNKGYITKVPFEIPAISGRYIPEKIDTGLVYTSERASSFKYAGRYDFTEDIKAQQEGGSLSVKDWNFIPDFHLNLFQNRIFFKKISSRGYYSPIGSYGFTYYNYTALGTYYEGNRKVYVIGFVPQRAYEAVIQGVIALYDSSYRVAYADFTISPETQLEFADSIHVTQNFGYKSGVYTQFNQRLDFRINLLKFTGLYEIDIYYDEFSYKSISEINIPKGPNQSRNKEDVFKKVSLWDTIRPVPLTREENNLLYNKNNNAQLRNIYPQNEMGLFEEFRWNTIKAFYQKYYRRFSDYSIKVDPFYYALGFNTVEGLYLNYDLPVTFHKPMGDLTINPELRYGFADDRLKYRLTAQWFYDLTEPNQFDFEIGHTYSQFNDEEPILPVVNAFYSLFLGQNFIRLYQKDYAKVGHKWELFNGFDVTGSFEFANRKPLRNRTLYSITGDRDNYTFNNPVYDPVIFSNGFTPHTALTGELNIYYRFKQLYKLINKRKYNLQMKTPVVYFNYKKGFSTPISATNFDFISGGLAFSTSVGNVGISSFDISGGSFLNTKKIEFIDFKHFNGVQTFFLQPTVDRTARIKQFSTLPYYDFSTQTGFLEIHYEHDFDGFLFSKSRYLRYTNIHSLVGFNYLDNYEQAPFLEFFIGVDNILHAVRIEFAGGIENFAKFNPSIRLGVDFDYLYYRKNRVKF